MCVPMFQVSSVLTMVQADGYLKLESFGSSRAQMQLVPSAHAGSVFSSPPKSQEAWPGAAPCPATTESCPSKMCGKATRHARTKESKHGGSALGWRWTRLGRLYQRLWGGGRAAPEPGLNREGKVSRREL